jgi:hypothetical protein
MWLCRGFTDFTIGRPWWEEKSVDHSEGPKTRVQDTVINGLITRILLMIKFVLGKIKKDSRIFLINKVVVIHSIKLDDIY